MIDIGADLQRAFDEGYEKGKADRPQGEWMWDDGHFCSECQCYAVYNASLEEMLTDYCPHCGARMFAKDINVPNRKGANDE